MGLGIGIAFGKKMDNGCKFISFSSNLNVYSLSLLQRF